jgi:hypothetical protein
MPNPIITTKDLDTGEEVTRPMTDTEFAQYQKDREADEALLAQAATQATAKAALLAQLGITEEQARLLLS